MATSAWRWRLGVFSLCIYYMLPYKVIHKGVVFILDSVNESQVLWYNKVENMVNFCVPSRLVFAGQVII